MAIKKTIDFKGFDPNYWAITTIMDNKVENKTKVIVSLYKNRATRLSQPAATIATLEFIIDGVDKKRSEIYPLLKTINPEALKDQPQIFFADGIDEIE